MNIRIAINPYHVNKMPWDLSESELKGWWRGFNGDFKNVNIPIAKFINTIRQGYSYTAQHSQYRKANNFVAGQHIGLDFDTGDSYSSVGYLSAIPFIRDNAAFIHETASHTAANPRARVIFILPFSFRDVRRYSVLTEAFAHKFGNADASCSDPVRLFFGAKGCDVVVFDNVLSISVAKTVATEYIEKRKTRIKSMPQNITINGSISRIMQSMLDSLAMTPDGQKWHQLGKTSLALGGYVAAGYVSETEAYDSLFAAIAPRARDTSVAEERIQWGLTAGQSDPLYLEEDRDPIMRSVFR